MTAQSDREQVNSAIQALVEQAATDPAYAAELSDDATGYLKAAGVPDSLLAELLKAEGLDEAEVQGYGFDLRGGGVPGVGIGGVGGGGAGPAGIIIGTICIGTCGNNTIVVGCTKSFAGGA